MWSIVRAHFPAFIALFEGREDCLYLDELCFLTTGVGNLMEPFANALALAWFHEKTGLPATKAEVLAACVATKKHTEWCKIGGGQPEWRTISDLRLKPEDIDNLVRGHFASDENILHQRIPNLPDVPADAQMGVAGMSWAMGPGFDYPAFMRAFSRLNFRACALECHIKNARTKRNVAHQQLFVNAACVVERGLPFDQFYPGDAPVLDVTDGGRNAPLFRGPFLDLPEDDGTA